MVEWAPQVGRGRIQFTLANHSKWTFIICTLTHSISVPNILLPTIYIFSSCSLSLSPVEILSLSNNLSTCFSSTELGMYKCCHGIESIIPWRFTIHKTKFCGRFSDEWIPPQHMRNARRKTYRVIMRAKSKRRKRRRRENNKWEDIERNTQTRKWGRTPNPLLDGIHSEQLSHSRQGNLNMWRSIEWDTHYLCIILAAVSLFLSLALSPFMCIPM